MDSKFLPHDYVSAENWIEEKLKELSNGKFIFADKRQKGKYRREWWRIVENTKWNKILFHFELIWGGNTAITEAKKICIVAHLECQFLKDKSLNEKIREKFDMPKGNTLPPKAEIIPDFSSEETAAETLMQIIRILNSEDFQKYADIANKLCRMNVKICSREDAEMLLKGDFPENTAVISFYDPAIKRIDKNYTHVDYSEKCKRVFYSEVDDLDIGYLGEKGLTYDTYFTEADEIAEFIYQAYNDGLDIICQCEYGQSRSAGCAAAIIEHFYKSGIWIFADYRYYPNQVIFHKIFDALEKYRKEHQDIL